MRLPIRFGSVLFPLVAALGAAACHGNSTGPSGGGGNSYTITLRYVDGTQPNNTVSAAFTRAVDKWQQVITDSVGSVPLNLGAGACDSVQPAVSETVRISSSWWTSGPSRTPRRDRRSSARRAPAS